MVIASFIMVLMVCSQNHVDQFIMARRVAPVLVDSVNKFSEQNRVTVTGNKALHRVFISMHQN